MALDDHYKLSKTDFDPEAAVEDFVNAYAREFGLSNWGIIYRVLDDKPDAFASVLWNLRTMEAHVDFRRNQTCESLEISACHELMHLAMARIENLFLTTVANHVPLSAQEQIKALMTDEMEAFVTGMAISIVKLRRKNTEDA